MGGLQPLTIYVQELQEAYNCLQYIYKNYEGLQTLANAAMKLNN